MHAVRLSYMFAQHRPEASSDSASLDQLLESVLNLARSVWPKVHVEDEAFLAYVAARLPEDKPVEKALSELRAADLYLCCACLEGNRRALLHFRSDYLPEIEAGLRRMDCAEGVKEDAIHALHHELFAGGAKGTPRLGRYSGRGDLRSWLRVSAVRKAQDFLRKTRAERPLNDENLADLAAGGEDQELRYLKQLYRREFKLAFAEAFQVLSAKERNILRLQLLDGLHAEQIAAIYQVHRITVVRWNGKIREKLFSSTKRALMRRLEVNPSEFESIARLIRSQMDMSICRHLKESA